MKSHKQNLKWHLLLINYYQHYFFYFNFFKQKQKLNYWELKYYYFLPINLFHFMNMRWNIIADLLRIIFIFNFLLLQNFIVCFLWWKTLSHKIYDLCLFFSDKDEKMQDEILDCANSEFFINEIIAHIMIATENNFEQCEFNFSKIIYVAIKKCEQFFKISSCFQKKILMKLIQIY